MKNVSLSLDFENTYEFVSPVLEVCGCMRWLLSALGAVRMFVFMVLYINNSQILARLTGGSIKFYQQTKDKD